MSIHRKTLPSKHRSSNNKSKQRKRQRSIQKQITLLKFEWMNYEVQVDKITPLVFFQDRVLCMVSISLYPIFGTPIKFDHPFYKSSGRNSGMSGTWFPFRGFHLKRLWFYKAYRVPDSNPPIWIKYRSEDEPYGRFGHLIYKNISDYLAKNEGFINNIRETDSVEELHRICPVKDYDNDNYEI